MKSFIFFIAMLHFVASETISKIQLLNNNTITDSDMDQYENVTVVTGATQIISCNNPNFKNIVGVNLLKTTGLFIKIDSNDYIENITGFSSLESITINAGPGIQINHNNNLQYIGGFDIITVIDGGLEIIGNYDLTTIAGFQSVVEILGEMEVESTHLTAGSLENAFPNLRCVSGIITCPECPARILNLNNSGICTLPPTHAPTTPSPTTLPPTTRHPTFAPTIPPPTFPPTFPPTNVPTRPPATVAPTGPPTRPILTALTDDLSPESLSGIIVGVVGTIMIVIIVLVKRSNKSTYTRIPSTPKNNVNQKISL